MTPLAVALASCGSDGAAPEGDAAGDYPSERIEMVVPYAAGGVGDTNARVLAPCLEQSLGQQILIMNEPGGGGTIGMGEVSRAEPDGYTIAITNVGGSVIAPLLNEGAGYALEDFEHIGLTYELPGVVLVPEASPHQSFDELVSAAQAAPNSLTMAMGDATSVYVLQMRALMESSDLPFNLVPSESNNGPLTALLGNNAAAVFAGATPDYLQLIDQGKARPVAVGSAERLDYLPDVPTLDELGYDATQGTTFFAMSVPAGVPDDVKSTLSAALEECLTSEEVIETLGDDYVPDSFIAGEEVATRYQEAAEVFTPVVESLQ
jgi:tripartite-type tricarboxylate transporter receptor subunit TctC